MTTSSLRVMRVMAGNFSFVSTQKIFLARLGRNITRITRITRKTGGERDEQ
jgi:hypothetical protein